MLVIILNAVSCSKQVCISESVVGWWASSLSVCDGDAGIVMGGKNYCIYSSK